MEDARKFVLNTFEHTVELALAGKLNTDFKSETKSAYRHKGYRK